MTVIDGNAPAGQALWAVRPIRIALVVGIVVFAVTTLASAASLGQPTAEQIVKSLKKAGLPIGKYRVYTAATDPNKLLGRPGQYTSKVNFNDTRIGFRSDYSVDGGGAVEVFPDESGAKSRYSYLVALAKSPLFAEYTYLQGKVVLRVAHELTPAQAKQYEVAFNGGTIGKVATQSTPSKARIVVRGSGTTSSSVLDAYGAILRNTSKRDAHQVFVQGNLVDRSGAIVAGVGPLISVIPAGATYYWGGTVPHRKGTHATRFEVTVKSADFSGTGAKLPLISKVRLSSDGYNTLVTGRVTNNVGFTLSQIATINVVFLNPKGKVIGGSSGFLETDLPRGRTALFEVNAFRIVPRRQIASVHVTMDAQRVP